MKRSAHDDILHWTKLNQNWNFMCAECHSTGVRKNYDAAKDRFATTLDRDQRRLRSVPRPGLGACRLGEGSEKLVALQERRPRQGAAGAFRRAERRDLGSRCEDRLSRAERFARGRAQGGRDLRALPRASGTESPRIGCRDGRSPTRISSLRSPKGSTRPTGRCSMRSIITARSSRARCTRQASPVAIATIRTAPS